MSAKDAPKKCGIAPAIIGARGVAKLLSVSERTIWMLHSSGRLPLPIRLPATRCVRWRVDELQAWILAGCPHRDRWTWPQGGRS